MKKLVRLGCLSVPFLFWGCATFSSSSKEEKHQVEVGLHKVRTDVEDIKHDLNTYEIEYHVLEGKLIDQEQTIASLKQQIGALKQKNLESFTQEMQNLDKKLNSLTKQQEKIISDIRQLSSHANETTTALSQYKEKIACFEKAVTLQNKQIQDLVKVQKGLSSLSSMSSKTYVVQAGDSLEKIARENNMQVETIKKLNNLSSDLIVVGQELVLP